MDNPKLLTAAPLPIDLPAAAETLLALMHAQAEVARLSEREHLFSSLLGSVNAVLWAFDWETQQMIYVSPAYERIFGRSAEIGRASCRERVS